MAMYSTNSIILLAFVICLLSHRHLTHGLVQDHFNVEGQVYCDTCRVQFITKATYYIKGAKVRLECKNKETNAIAFSAEAETDHSGKYQIEVQGEHEDCRVIPISSPDSECNEISKDPFLKKSDKIALTHQNGISSNTRTANPIGFLKKVILPQCSKIVRQIKFTATGLVP
ncbi:hypothetical protein P3X46_003448 [Hevea brasiliensis]|uniref:Pollen Ole e 1 allergen and extensin family protein n=1 Tax=Hevea brasiliensis TaxID=3981 RepID=A0ABQ9N8I3_HEVBR|nr:olee1-like protein [Hevea brasiliensis]KAJ9188053.1 hypothetical protein P3X46_003448 [Hevea brasiliensis]